MKERQFIVHKVSGLQKELIGLLLIQQEIELQPCKADTCVFVNKKDNKFITVGLYVDDGIIVRECEELINIFIQQLNKDTKIQKLKKNVKFLGIDVENKGSSASITRAQMFPYNKNMNYYLYY